MEKPTSQPRVHILGICGRASSGIAKLFQDLGWEVTGSDQGAYPPITDYLDSLHISYNASYSAHHITSDIDLVVVAGNTLHIDPHNEEFEAARRLDIPVKSYPEILSDFIIKQQSIVVTGTYGKTTITDLLAKIFSVAGKDPSYMIGDLSLDFPESLHQSPSTISIVEGDEHPTFGYSSNPKFSYYRPTDVIITSALWDHYNIYETEDKFIRVFQDLVSSLPANAIIIANKRGENLNKVVASTTVDIIWYEGLVHDASMADTTYFATDLNYESGITQCNIHTPDGIIHISTNLFGQHNIENMVAAIAMSKEFGIDNNSIQQACLEFKGLKRRLELRAEFPNAKIYHDQGQLPAKANAAVEAVREKYPHQYILVIYDTQASVLHHQAALTQLQNAFTSADMVLIPKVAVRSSSQGDRVTGRDILNSIAVSQRKVEYIPKDDLLAQRVFELTKDKNAVILFLTTGDIRGLIGETEKILRSRES